MKTLEELMYYCEEPEPVGAVLLTGEWGCGKTYLIDNGLKEALKVKAHIIRISLFGITTIDGIHMAVKQAWISEYNKDKKWKTVAEKAQQGKDVVGKLEFLPEWVRGIATTDWQSFIEIKNTIEEKSVVLVFDDLERCCMDTVDVLGVINDYCENQKFHTIIVANQDKTVLLTDGDEEESKSHLQLGYVPRDCDLKEYYECFERYSLSVDEVREYLSDKEKKLYKMIMEKKKMAEPENGAYTSYRLNNG